MKCAHCGQKPPRRCYSEGFDCTGGVARTDCCEDLETRRTLVTSSEIELIRPVGYCGYYGYVWQYEQYEQNYFREGIENCL